MSVARRLSELEASMLFAHRANIERYGKLLKTYLTDVERTFVKHRLTEEQAALDQLLTAGLLAVNGSSFLEDRAEVALAQT